MPETDADLKSRRYRHRQRWIMPLVIIAVAIGFMLWTQRQQQQRLASLDQYFRDICADVIRGADPTDRIVADVPEKRQGFIDTLRSVLAGVTDPRTVEVSATVGDTSPYADGRANHTAMISVDGRPVLGVRIRWPKGQPLQIVGYWVPDTSGDAPAPVP